MPPQPALEMGSVTLSVSDLARSCAFYERVIGLHRLERSSEAVRLGSGETIVLELIEKPGGRLNPSAPGLFHFALLVPSRPDLGNVLRRLTESHTRLDGGADHIVSEALYLSDPDGHGIEIYRDRPRSEWRYGDDGSITMATLPLDLPAVHEASQVATTPHALPDGTRMGHVHLQVNDVVSAGDLLIEVMGLELMAAMPRALFLGADGYHHHIGVNSWRTRGGVRGPNELGLEHMNVRRPAWTGGPITVEVEGIPISVASQVER